MQAAYETLVDDTARRAYDRFGAQFVDPGLAATFLGDWGHLVGFYAQTYGPALFMAFLLTRGKQRAGAFTWALVPLFAVALCDLFGRHAADDYDLTVLVAPHAPLFVKLQILHLSLMYVVGVIAFCVEAAYVDTEAQTRDALAEIKIMLECLLVRTMASRDVGVGVWVVACGR